MKICTKCKKEKNEKEFGKNKNSPNGLRPDCKNCRSSYCKIYHLKNKDKNNAACKKWNRSNPKKIRDIHLKRQYGINIEEWQKLFEKQNGCCGICAKHQSTMMQPLHTDHDHETGKIRGLLCRSCNQGLGFLKDSENLLQSALVYLARSKIKIMGIK